MQFPAVNAVRPSHCLRLKAVITIAALVPLLISAIALSPEIEYGDSDGHLLVTAEASERSNVALASNGATASASSTLNNNFHASGTNNGDRKGTNWGNGGGWNDSSGGSFPDWLQIDFNGSKTIDEIDLFTVQDNYSSPSEPTETMTFSTYGLTGYDVQYWNGTAWTTVAGGSITGNNKVWRKLTFPSITTTKIKVLTNAAIDNSYSRITEIEAWGATSENVTETAQPATINFDSLPTFSLVTNQYAQVKFSATGFSGGQGGPQGFDVYTQSNFGSGGSTPNAIFSTYNPAFSDPRFVRGLGPLYLEFTVPVNDLSFSLLNVRQTRITVWVYVNRFFYGYYTIFAPPGNGSLYRVNDFAGIPGITGVQINPDNFDPFFGVPVALYYDDFSFTPDFDVRITNARVNGVLNGTSQNALVGADIALNASVIPSSQTGGAYSWTFTGSPPVVVGAANSSSVTIRSTDTGTLTAKVTYTKNGFTASGTVTINAVLPTLTNFTAQQGSDRVSAPGTCNSPDTFWWYRLGCSPQEVGVNFTTTVHAPAFISDPSQSGIKYVQAVSTFRKQNRVGLRCFTNRSSEFNIASGWQLDKSDPYDPARRFSEGNDITMVTVDYPKNVLTFITAPEFTDVLYIDDRFEMYVVYFTGSNATTPVFQRPLGKLGWNWGGQVVFDWNGTNAIHNLRFTNAPPGARTGVPATSMVTMQGIVQNNVDVPCPGGPALTNNKIDSSRVFVKYHYLDFLDRNPAGDATHPPDLVGWNFWTSQISQCVFDLNCIHAKRIDTGLAFFYSGEFIQADPDMANPPGSPGFNPAVYNRRFVYWCYQKYLHRDPTGDPGWDFWTNDLNSNGNYQHIIDAFQLSGDYRDRPFS